MFFIPVIFWSTKRKGLVISMSKYGAPFRSSKSTVTNADFWQPKSSIAVISYCPLV